MQSYRQLFEAPLLAATSRGYDTLVVDKRPHLGGNAHDRHDDAGLLVQPPSPQISTAGLP